MKIRGGSNIPHKRGANPRGGEAPTFSKKLHEIENFLSHRGLAGDTHLRSTTENKDSPNIIQWLEVIILPSKLFILPLFGAATNTCINVTQYTHEWFLCISTVYYFRLSRILFSNYSSFLKFPLSALFIFRGLWNLYLLHS